MATQVSDSQQYKSATSHLIRKGSIITIITLVSRFLGYGREAIQAYLFGATLVVDAFVVAYNFPETIQTLFFTGATSAFLVPVCTKFLGDNEEYSNIYSTFLNLGIILTTLVSLLFFAFSGPLAYAMAPGFDPEKRQLTQLLFIVMIPLIVFETMLSIMKAHLNAKEHFVAPELSGILWNIFTIASALVLSRWWGIYSFAFGVTAGTLLQVIMQYPYLKSHNIRYRFVMDLAHPAVAEAKHLFVGALLATSIVPINTLIGRFFASYLPHGEISHLSYASRIFILPYSLFAVPVYTVMFSKISRLYHEKDWKAVSAHLDSSIVLLAATLIPSTILLCSMGDLCIRVIYQRGAFSINDTMMTNRALFGYTIGLIFYALSFIFVRVFNAMHDVKTPARVGLITIALNALLAVTLMTQLGGLGISLATSMASFFNFTTLYLIYRNRTGYALSRKAIRDIIKALLGGILLLISIFTLRRFITPIAGSTVYPALFGGAFLTALIYGILFKNYYLSLFKRR